MTATTRKKKAGLNDIMGKQEKFSSKIEALKKKAAKLKVQCAQDIGKRFMNSVPCLREEDICAAIEFLRKRKETEHGSSADLDGSNADGMSGRQSAKSDVENKKLCESGKNPLDSVVPEPPRKETGNGEMKIEPTTKTAVDRPQPILSTIGLPRFPGSDKQP